VAELGLHRDNSTAAHTNRKSMPWVHYEKALRGMRSFACIQVRLGPPPRLEMDRTGHVNWHEIVKFSYSKTSP